MGDQDLCDQEILSMGALWGSGASNEKKSTDNNFISYLLDGGTVTISTFLNISYTRVLNLIYSR